MISDNIKNWERYAFGPVWESIMLWITQKASPCLPEGSYCISGCNINVFTTTTRSEGSCLYESHRLMCDLQIVLKGEEYFFSRPYNNLEIEGTFNLEKDIVFYRPNQNNSGINKLILSNDIWALVFPWEAHLPAITTAEEPSIIKKLIVKIPLTMLTVSKIRIGHGYF